MKLVVPLTMLVILLAPSDLTAEDPKTLSENNPIVGRHIDDSAGSVPASRMVMIRTRDGYYFRAKLGGGHDVVADVRNPKTSEVFTMEWTKPNSVRLRTSDGYYVGAREGGGSGIDATVKMPLTSEEFRVEWLNDEHTQLRLRTRDGFYIHPVLFAVVAAKSTLGYDSLKRQKFSRSLLLRDKEQSHARNRPFSNGGFPDC